VSRVILFGALVLLICSAHPVSAQSVYVVDRLTDTGEGAGLSGDLRYCITQATSGLDTITFGVTGMINLTRALPNLATSVTIAGPGADRLTVRRDTGGAYRVFTVSQSATVIISGLSISNSNSGSGGGITNAGTLTVHGCRITSNSAASSGGGIFNSGALTVMSSTVDSNLAGGLNVGQGGGIYNSGDAIISNSTIAYNSAEGPGAWGAGIYNIGTLSINNSTVAGNWAIAEVQSGGGGVVTEGICCGEHGVLHSRNTIIAANYAQGCRDVLGPLGSLGHNLIGDGDCTVPDPTDLVNIDPLLGPLQDNGGPTPTFALLPFSPAIDAGDNAGAPEYDQRGPGFPRIVNGIIDIGAFEFQGRCQSSKDSVVRGRGLPRGRERAMLTARRP